MLPDPLPKQRHALPAVDRVALLALPAIKLVIHLFTAGRYSYFRDEFYGMDCGRHLDWGYVDHAPLLAVWSKLGMLFGPGLLGFRMPAVLAGVLLIALVVLIARELGGGKYAQRLAAVSMLAAPGLLQANSLLTMNAFEPLFWMGCVLAILLVRRTGNGRYWLLFGACAGLGLENKHSTLFFGAAVFLALLFSPLRREFTRPWIWLGALTALLLFLPNLVWQVRHGFPTLQFLQNVEREHKNIVLSPFEFLSQQLLAMNPLLAGVWGVGVGWTLIARRARPFHWIGVTWLAGIALFIAMHAKIYYAFPLYGMTIAAGAVAWEQAGVWGRRSGIGIVAGSVAVGAALAPVVLPILEPQQLVDYLRAIHLQPPQSERNHTGLLPQHFGDQFGWESMVRETAQAYRALPEADRARTILFANNYGEAGALNFFGPRYGLPQSISNHNTYWMWGPRGLGQKGSDAIVLGDSPKGLAKWCGSVEVLALHQEYFGMPYENGPILLCRGLKVSLSEAWPRLKKWI